MMISSIRKAIGSLNLQFTMKRFIRIQHSKTPNPNFLKFIPVGKLVLGDKGTLDISEQKFASISPLAEDLFKIQGVTRVFFGSDYLSVAKKQEVDWDNIRQDIYRKVDEHYESKRPILIDQASLDSTQINPDDSQTVQFIKEIIAARIRPNVQEDGGDVKFVSFDEPTGVLMIRMEGACSGCPSSMATLKGGIQKMLNYYIKEIKQVIAQQE